MGDIHMRKANKAQDEEPEQASHEIGKKSRAIQIDNGKMRCCSHISFLSPSTRGSSGVIWSAAGFLAHGSSHSLAFPG